LRLCLDQCYSKTLNQNVPQETGFPPILLTDYICQIHISRRAGCCLPIRRVAWSRLHIGRSSRAPEQQGGRKQSCPSQMTGYTGGGFAASSMTFFTQRMGGCPGTLSCILLEVVKDRWTVLQTASRVFRRHNTSNCVHIR
jgi:hypothetical protein